MHNFLISNGDTDSLTFYKKDQSFFSKEERAALLIDINSIFPEGLVWENDGYYPCMVVVAAKNYILQDEEGKVTIKGASLKATSKEPALKEFIDRLIKNMLEGKDNYKDIYQEYVNEIANVSDISRWCSKRSISDKVLDAKRAQEQKVKDIIEDTEYVEGDKIYCFFLPDGKLCLREKFDGTYDQAKLLQKLYNTAVVFSSVLPVDELFPNYSLTKYFKDLNPEQAQLKKEIAARKRKEAIARKLEALPEPEYTPEDTDTYLYS